MNTPGDFDVRMNILKQEYRVALPAKIATISSEWSLFCTEWNPEILEKLLRDFHTLIGSSGTFGFLEISITAKEIEKHLKKLYRHENASIKENIEIVTEISLEIKSLIEVVRREGGHETNYSGASKNSPAHKSIYEKKSAKDIIIYYLDSNFVAAQLLMKKLNAYGFKCEHFESMVDFLQKMQSATPDLVIMELFIPSVTSTKTFDLAKSIVKMGVKVFILSESNEFDNYLSAVRAGVHAYIDKPSDFSSIIARIRTTLQLHGNRLSKILIVDDQEAVAEYYAAVLRNSGMIVQVESIPSNVLKVMNESMPDLLLLDLNMPHVSGLELAEIIRQQDQFQSIPIIFLSADEAYTKSSLLELGIDDLLKKGIAPEEFVLHIKSRVNRAQTLASKIYQDSLTGLLNHAQIQRSLEKEFLRSKRHSFPLSVVMIDIDKFKLVNDTYGHLVGDKVILALSHLLDQRLRSIDHIGRLGGEEFLIVMSNCTVNNASTLIDQLRVIFSDFKFEANGEEFSVSFSAGISGIEGMSMAIEQLKRADDALYQAKIRGRNLVCAADYEDKKKVSQ